MVTIGRHPARIDITLHAGEPIDFTVDVLDKVGADQSLTLWTALAQIRATADPSAVVLHTFALTLTTGEVQVTASSVDTAAWTFFAAPWDLVLTAPAGTKTVHAAGWVRCYPTISR